MLTYTTEKIHVLLNECVTNDILGLVVSRVFAVLFTILLEFTL